MFSVRIFSVVATLLMSGAAFAQAQANPIMRNGKSVFGTPADASVATRVIDVQAGSSVNVTCGDVVTFKSGEKSFTWRFDVAGHRSPVLSTIAPAGFVGNDFKVYVSRNRYESF